MNSKQNIHLQRINQLLLDQNNNLVGENKVLWLSIDEIAKEINRIMQGKKKSLVEDAVH